MSRIEDHDICVTLNLSCGYGTEVERQWVYSFQAAVDEALRSARAGEVDGNEFGDGKAVVRVTGPDLRLLHDVVEGVLTEWNEAATRLGAIITTNCS